MAISLLQDAQTRSLAAALAGLKRDDVDRSMSLSPPMSANTSASGAAAMYSNSFQQAAAASAFGMLSPTQLLEANRQAAAAFMAAQLPMSTLATTLFPHHPALFGNWGAPQTTHMHSPPASPHSPLATTPVTTGLGMNVGATKLSLASPATTPNSQCSSNNGGNIGEPVKRARKLTVKKEFQSPSANAELSMSVNDLYNTPGGPISPPSSGSSPNSTNDGPTAAHANTANLSTSSTASTTAAAGKDPSRDKSFTCKICSRSFGYKHVLQNHERTHTGEKPFECPECHKRFTRDHHLKTHMRLHTGEKPYHCSHCDRQFVQVANLRRHLRVHTGERPYTCEICDGKFSDSNQLKSHMLVHNGEKPFECERCHMKFRRRHHLMNHKCGIQSPPTPAISPAMSGDYPMGHEAPIVTPTTSTTTALKYPTLGSSYCGSEESIELKSSAATMAAMSLNAAAVAAAAAANAVTDNMQQSGDEDAPLDLSEDGASSVDGNCSSFRLRKAQDIRRVFRLPPPQIMHVPTDMPEQTEPEDLSMHSPRSMHLQPASSPESLNMSMHDDIDLDELDDAATLYLRQQQQFAAAAALKRSMNMA